MKAIRRRLTQSVCFSLWLASVAYSAVALYTLSVSRIHICLFYICEWMLCVRASVMPAIWMRCCNAMLKRGCCCFCCWLSSVPAAASILLFRWMRWWEEMAYAQICVPVCLRCKGNDRFKNIDYSRFQRRVSHSTTARARAFLMALYAWFGAPRAVAFQYYVCWLRIKLVG